MAPVRKNSTLPAGNREDPTKPPMFRFQESLPKLPVPTLEETASRYLKSLQPLLTPEELKDSTAAVQEFIKPGGIGQELQKKLQAKAADPNVKNWMIDWWNFSAYLGYRDPVVPYVSYFYSYKDDKKRRDQATRAAAITTGVLSFKDMVDKGTLEPEYMKKAPLCMDSYQYMFNCCRIPEKPADFPRKFAPEENKHVVVMRKGQFYKVMHEVDAKQLSTRELEEQFRRILELAKGNSVPPVGALTSENRDIWTDARAKLVAASARNEEALEIIESASFLICLDDTSPVTLEERAHQYWHGDGKNRWYDKPLQFIINENGSAGFMGEHSMMDGTPTHRLSDYVNEVIFREKITFDTTTLRSNLPEPAEVKFVLNKDVETEIFRAEKDFTELIGKHELKVQMYLGYGKGLIKKFKCSPDAYVQMIIQLAYYKMYGKNRPTYESAATRKYQLGRTETCMPPPAFSLHTNTNWDAYMNVTNPGRSVSTDSVAFCKAMEDPTAPPSICAQLLRKAIDSHVSYITDASSGHGVDRHLFGLKQLLPSDKPKPSIFTDPAYAYSSTWYLSTSQLSSEWFNGYGWSQVIDEGFGVAYMINEGWLSFNVVSKGLGSERLGYFLGQAAEDMREVMEAEARVQPVKANL
ncbi:acyltransferase ChoActase/COT/CPT [Terfezia boudieri ATCC MYA-4762]|uniref:Carnitine O-acetyltransferase, mitochondrial n=1 Tax=Terfezia boudieri ATCC MYA-4762 TaxID=1051890 RepID=A0A3N4LGI4_9PEZI|nr:acyltransferase ChoActase/COT/CPT [Terfezia boudieri ATCC MYA-4762]